MERIKINFSESELHMALNVSEERVNELARIYANISLKAREMGFVTERIEGNQSVTTVHGPLLLDHLMNNVADTEEERILMTVQFMDLLKYIKAEDMKRQALKKLKDFVDGAQTDIDKNKVDAKNLKI